MNFARAAILLATAFAMPVLAQTVPPLVRFSGGVQQLAAIKGERATVFNDAGQGQFQAAQSYIFEHAGKVDGTVYAWNPTTGRVRITPLGEPGVWLACSELNPMSIACAVRLTVGVDGAIDVASTSRRARAGATRGFSLGSGEEANASASRLPACPGDPRCPGK